MQSLHASLEDEGYVLGEGAMAVITDAFHPLHTCYCGDGRNGDFKRSRVATLTPSRVAFMHGLHAFSPSCTATLSRHRRTGTLSRHFTDTAVILLCRFLGLFCPCFCFLKATTDRVGITGADLNSLYSQKSFHFSI